MFPVVPVAAEARECKDMSGSPRRENIVGSADGAAPNTERGRAMWSAPSSPHISEGAHSVAPGGEVEVVPEFTAPLLGVDMLSVSLSLASPSVLPSTLPAPPAAVESPATTCGSSAPFVSPVVAEPGDMSVVPSSPAPCTSVDMPALPGAGAAPPSAVAEAGVTPVVLAVHSVPRDPSVPPLALACPAPSILPDATIESAHMIGSGAVGLLPSDMGNWMGGRHTWMGTLGVHMGGSTLCSPDESACCPTWVPAWMHLPATWASDTWVSGSEASDVGHMEEWELRLASQGPPLLTGWALRLALCALLCASKWALRLACMLCLSKWALRLGLHPQLTSPSPWTLSPHVMSPLI